MSLFNESYLEALKTDESVGILLFEVEKSQNASTYEAIFKIFSQSVNWDNYKIVPKQQIFYYKTSTLGSTFDKLVIKELLAFHKDVMGYDEKLLNKRKYVNFKYTKTIKIYLKNVKIFLFPLQ